MGTLNHHLGGRSRHFKNVEDRVARLLDHVDSQAVDHVLCTGDLTAMSYEIEFEQCARLFGHRLEQPERYTVLAGNHDRYTHDSAASQAFEQYFEVLSSKRDAYPLVKQVANNVTLVAIDPARPTAFLDSSGRVGSVQLQRLEEIVTDPRLNDHFVILALHYGLYRSSGKPDHRSHGLRDFDELVQLIRREESRIDLVLHGHLHYPYEIRLNRCRIICAGSATDLHYACGYHVYDIDVASRDLSVLRHGLGPRASILRCRGGSRIRTGLLE